MQYVIEPDLKDHFRQFEQELRIYLLLTQSPKEKTIEDMVMELKNKVLATQTSPLSP